MTTKDSTIEFAHLHVHTQYSLLDGSSKIDELIGQVKDLGMKSIAITDHGVMYGVVDFYDEAVKQGIKPIIGCEVYVANRKRTDKETGIDNTYYHLVLLAENQEGYQNLMRLVSDGFTEGFYYKPRIDLDLLRRYSKGIIGLSACLGGHVPNEILRGDRPQAKEVAMTYNEIFGQGNFFLELQDHGYEEQHLVNKALIEMSEELSIPLVATNDVHYTYKEDVEAHDILLCIQTNKKVTDEDRMRYAGGQFYLKSPEEMSVLFSYVPDALRNTVEIARRCQVDFEFGQYKLPRYELDESIDKFTYIKDICNEGLKERYEIITETHVKRLNYELGVIEEMGFIDYFLITWDFIKFARDNHIMVGPGRGSAAGSLVSYCLKITDIDPLKYNLLFERFLNPERISMPDIDIDFCYERRQEVIDYVVKKYGEDKVAQIITFGTMAARAAIRDVGRALDMPYNEVDKVAKMIPQELKITIKKALTMNRELQSLYDEDEQVKYLIDMSKRLEGLTRHSSTHAAGVVICDRAVNEYVPLNTNDDAVTTQFTMNTLERLGLLKMDFLGLRTLTVIQDAILNVKKSQGIQLDMNLIDDNDPKVFELIGTAKTEGVFQLESDGMKNFMKDLKPQSLEDIIAGISLYRPGPMEFIPAYIQGSRHAKDITYDCPQLEPILKPTYGVIVYQEQVMQIVRDLAGYTLGRSDLVRRAMSKKKEDVMLKERANFIYGNKEEGVLGCVNNGIDVAAANRIFDKMTDFAKYAFNKSHAAAYAIIAYQTAWIKAYYPVEFMAALLTSVMFGGGKVAEYIYSLKAMGIEVLPPDINEGYYNFSVSKGKIRYGLAAVKNVGRGVIDHMVAEREVNGPYVSLTDFCTRMDAKDLNKRMMENLIYAGAFTSLGGTRKQYIHNYKFVLEAIHHEKKATIHGQMNLFDLTEELQENKADQFEAVGEFSKEQLLTYEKEVMGIYLSGHPLEDYADVLNRVLTNKSLDFQPLVDGTFKVTDGTLVKYGGIISNKVVKTTRNNQTMAFLSVEDLFGTVEVVVFPNDYEANRHYLNEDEVVIVKGRVSTQEDQDGKIVCQTIRRLDDVLKEVLYIQFDDLEHYKSVITQITPLLKAEVGQSPVVAYLKDTKRKNDFGGNYLVTIKPSLIKNLEALMDKENVKVVKSLLKF